MPDSALVYEATSETSVLMPKQTWTHSCFFWRKGKERANIGSSAGSGCLIPKAADALLRPLAAVRSRPNSLPCLRQVHWGDASVAFKVTAAGREFEQISHWSLSKGFMFHLLQEMCETYFSEKAIQRS